MENFTIETSIGRLGISIEDEQLCSVALDTTSRQELPHSSFAKEVANQFNQYFDCAEFCFNLPLKRSGTEHQLKVWQALSTIPSGQVLTYGMLANQVGSSARAIGNACRTNPIPIVVPCHRIVAASNIGGFSGATKGTLLGIKRDLLLHEGHQY